MAACSSAFATDSLIAGFNFGQFIGPGYPSTDPDTGAATGFIGANFQGNNQPAQADSGIYRVNNGLSGSYNPGYATWYWDGSNNSGTFNFAGGNDVVVYEKYSLNSVNQLTVNGYNMTGADLNFAGLSFAITNQKWSIALNTTGFTDTATANNFSFAAFGTGGTAIVEWFLNGSNTAFTTTNIAAGTDYTAYAVDLPGSFYGQSAVTLEGRLTQGVVTFDNVMINGATAIPEPSSFAAIAGVFGLGFAAYRRRRSAA